MTIVPKLIQQPNLSLMDGTIQIIEVEHPDYNSETKCNNCKRTGYWNKGVINRKTKRLALLEEPYRPDAGISPKRHLCMKDGVDKWINKYEKINMRLYDYHQHHYMCIECAREFNKEIYPLCPSCWKMECRRCHARVPWRANKESYCVDCGNEKRDAVHVWRSMYRLYGKPKEVEL